MKKIKQLDFIIDYALNAEIKRRQELETNVISEIEQDAIYSEIEKEITKSDIKDDLYK